MIRLAFGSVPKDGGTFTFYRNMRPELLSHGIDMRCVAIGKQQAALWEDQYVDEGCVLLASTSNSIKKQAQSFTAWCESESIDIVMGINSEAILSSLPHLPMSIRCMSRCANSFDHGYKITLSGYQRLAAIIAQTPRQKNDLTQIYDADDSLISVIPNGIETNTFNIVADSRELRTKKHSDTPIRIGFLGRLEHKQKGVLFIPEILNELEELNINYELTIAGKGKHREALESELASRIKQGRVKTIGAIPPTEIPSFLKRTEVFLFPSQFEGCPNALLEAMMAGCAPVAWQLNGITDFIIEHGKTGFLSQIEDHSHIAKQIARLARDHELLLSIQKNASADVQNRFATPIAAKAYSKTIHRVMADKPPVWTPTSWNQFKPDPNFTHSWKDYIPSNLKNKIKKFINR